MAPPEPSKPMSKHTPVSISAQKANSRCAKCGVFGHWYNDGLCRAEDIRAMTQAKIDSSTVNAFRIATKPKPGYFFFYIFH